MLPAIAVGLGAACLSMSAVESLTGLYFSFAFVRSLGQGALSLVSVWIVGEWFQRRRGMATGLAGMGGALSVMTIPLLNNWIIANYDWQTAWVVLGLAVWVLLVIPGLLLIRNRPEDIGWLPDGHDASVVHQPRKSGPVINEHSWTVSEVIRDATFWKLLSVPATSGLVGTGLIFHQANLLGQHGVSRSWAFGLMTVQALFATLMIFPVGRATDRFASRHILFAAMGFLAAATLLLMVLPFPGLALVYALLLGFQGSIMRSTGTVVWINYYGRGNQGAVRGVAFSVMILASAVGPLPLAVSIDHFGSYNPALICFLILPLLSALAVLSAKPRLVPRG